MIPAVIAALAPMAVDALGSVAVGIAGSVGAELAGNAAAGIAAKMGASQGVQDAVSGYASQGVQNFGKNLGTGIQQNQPATLGGLASVAMDAGQATLADAYLHARSQVGNFLQSVNNY